MNNLCFLIFAESVNISMSTSRRPSESSRRGSMVPGPSIHSEASSRIFIPPNQTILGLIWEVISPWVWKLAVFYTKIFLFLASFGLFIITTIILYSMVYYLAVPKRLHTYPVHFDFGKDHACANVTLANRQWEGLARPIIEWDRPVPGYDFDITLTIEFPNTHHNLEQGPVMMETSVLLRDYSPVAKTRRPFLVPQMSTLARLFRDALTMAVSGLHLYQDKQTQDIDLIESLPIFHHESLSFVSLCMNPPIHVYSATLNFTSKLSGLRYLISHHPIFTGFLVVSVVVALATVSFLGMYIVRYIKKENGTQVEPFSPISPTEDIIGCENDQIDEDINEGGLRRRRD